ncbi:Serine/threonine protein kinase KIN1 [Golovinomyces cichoracearum]|uniref:Serine/threonine protein kinase KIN1 n=1 Tax=Golovinomyces cichoracearum TaxID=62708 RepID=A0A420IMX8_9PEZI|nr:Serine/threonine protein kinase KIN1 [Golovinomyces cichoracearum]
MSNPNALASRHLYQPRCFSASSHTTNVMGVNDPSPESTTHRFHSNQTEPAFLEPKTVASPLLLPKTEPDHSSFSPLCLSQPRPLSDTPQPGLAESSRESQKDLPAHINTSIVSDSHRCSVESIKFGCSLKTTTKTTVYSPDQEHHSLASQGINSNRKSGTCSTLSSPILGSIDDLTPLPSPILSEDSKKLWRSETTSVTPHGEEKSARDYSSLPMQNNEFVSSAATNQLKTIKTRSQVTETSAIDQNIFHKMEEEAGLNCTQKRFWKICELQPKESRKDKVGGSHAPPLESISTESIETLDLNLRREPKFSAQRGLEPIPRPPTPPSSTKKCGSTDSDSSTPSSLSQMHMNQDISYFEAYVREDMKLKRWKGLEVIGEGVFSKVILATSENLDNDFDDKIYSVREPIVNFGSTSVLKRKKHKKLAAIKICDYGPKGGASEERVEISVKREIEFMKEISHPSVIHLRAWNIEVSRAILVLDYCPGGDLFQLASEKFELLVPGLIRRIFAELVAAVRYLHSRKIVHRDIKLENVLVNFSCHGLNSYQDWSTFPYSLVTVTDLGLARRITDGEKLTTRCGSDDYAAPEVIMGQSYDGCAVDAWSLGVLLYTLLESRLPFDSIPGTSENNRQRSSTCHRIARIEWSWVKYCELEGDHIDDADKLSDGGLKGAIQTTEGLLRRARSRWTLDQVAEMDWVKGGIQIKK